MFEASSPGLPEKIFWSKLEYLGANTAAPLLFLFFWHYPKAQKELPFRRAGLFFILPLLTSLMVMTNEWHYWYWTGFEPVKGAVNLYIYHHGPVYWIALAYNYLCATGVVFLLLRNLFLSRGIYRLQFLAFLLSSVFPYISGLVYSGSLNPFPGLDFLPLAFSLAGLGVVLSILLLRVFDLVPVARNTLVEMMSDGVLVLDSRQRVVDINPAALSILRTTGKAIIGSDAVQIFQPWPEVLTGLESKIDFQKEISLVKGEEKTFYQLKGTALKDYRDFHQGWVVVFQDITPLVLINKQLQTQLTEIEYLQADLLEQTIRDPLTGLFNRRYMTETLEREFARAARENYPLCLIMMDIDDFKKINDSFGHNAGDIVLQNLGRQLQAQTRAGDILCRYGGDEFLAVLPNTMIESAMKWTERWQELVITASEPTIRINLSFGVAAFPTHGKDSTDVLAAADGALYQAKAAGRNCVVVYSSQLQCN